MNDSHETFFAISQPVAYDILSIYGQFPTMGLADNMVYDVIPAIPSAVGLTAVNASVYEVDCAALPNAAQQFNNTVLGSGNTRELLFAIAPDDDSLFNLPLPCTFSPCADISALTPKCFGQTIRPYPPVSCSTGTTPPVQT